MSLPDLLVRLSSQTHWLFLPQGSSKGEYIAICVANRKSPHCGRHYRREDLSRGAQGCKVWGEDLTPGAVLQIVQHYARAMGLEKLAPHDMRRNCAKLCRKRGGDLEQIKFLLGHVVDSDLRTVFGSGAGLRLRRE
jgi:hypothetical protein